MGLSPLTGGHVVRENQPRLRPGGRGGAGVLGHLCLHRACLCGQGLQEGVRGSAQAGFPEEGAQHQPCSGAQKSVGRGGRGALLGVKELGRGMGGLGSPSGGRSSEHLQGQAEKFGGAPRSLCLAHSLFPHWGALCPLQLLSAWEGTSESFTLQCKLAHQTPGDPGGRVP